MFLSESNYFFSTLKKPDNFFGRKCLAEEIGMEQDILEEIQK